MGDNPIKVSGFNHYAISVSVVPVSLNFYTRILGLKAIVRPEFDFPGAWLDCGNGIQLHLIEGKPDCIGADGTRSLHFAFAVADINAFKAHLTSNHINIVKDIKARPDGILQMFIQDPDGYFIEITQLQDHVVST
ncbi:MAG: VOC family protein [Saprospiraceae bacterium]|nr:VOC family protein [Saprospiraceae bacterium]